MVRKSQKVLELYDGQELVKTYTVIVGKKSGAKKIRGDSKTPEGEFYICVRNDRSRYYLALGLSYPTPMDAARGRKKGIIGKGTQEQIVTAHRAHRQPTWKSKLGGAIMIHGVAPGRSDTQGCIALRNNEDMKEIFDLIPLGAPVVIYP